MLVDDFVVDLGLVVTVLDVVLVDAVVDDFVLVMVDGFVVDIVQLEVGVLALAKWKAFRPTIFPLV